MFWVHRTSVLNKVQAALDKGLTLEQTVEQTQMPEFGGYLLFVLVHPSLNVPAAYRDLRKNKIADWDRLTQKFISRYVH